MSALPLFALALIWLAVGGTLALRGGDVDKPHRMPQLYGYTVCLIALIVAMVSLVSIVNAVFDRANPLHAGPGFGSALTSFDAYKATRQQQTPFLGGSRPTPPDTASEAALRKQYDALVTDRIATTRYRTTKSLTTSAIFLVIAFGLFAVHWRWVRRLNDGTAAGA